MSGHLVSVEDRSIGAGNPPVYRREKAMPAFGFLMLISKKHLPGGQVFLS